MIKNSEVPAQSGDQQQPPTNESAKGLAIGEIVALIDHAETVQAEIAIAESGSAVDKQSHLAQLRAKYAAIHERLAAGGALEFLPGTDEATKKEGQQLPHDVATPVAEQSSTPDVPIDGLDDDDILRQAFAGRLKNR